MFLSRQQCSHVIIMYADVVLNVIFDTLYKRFFIDMSGLASFTEIIYSRTPGQPQTNIDSMFVNGIYITANNRPCEKNYVLMVKGM